jgi:hypothetical protein
MYMAKICIKAAGSCKSCRNYKFDPESSGYACFMPESENMFNLYLDAIARGDLELARQLLRGKS